MQKHRLATFPRIVDSLQPIRNRIKCFRVTPPSPVTMACKDPWALTNCPMRAYWTWADVETSSSASLYRVIPTAGVGPSFGAILSTSCSMQPCARHRLLRFSFCAVLSELSSCFFHVPLVWSAMLFVYHKSVQFLRSSFATHIGVVTLSCRAKHVPIRYASCMIDETWPIVPVFVCG